MSGKLPKFIHRGVVKDRKPIFDNPDMYEVKMTQLEGKRFEMELEPEKQKKSRDQMAFYFGGIIRSECMNTNMFGGWNEKEIHQYLLREITQYHKSVKTADGRNKVVICHDTREDFKGYSKEETSSYLNKVIIFLSTTHAIIVKDPAEYKLKKYEAQVEHEEIVKKAENKIVQPFKDIK